ncbi:hypothetical protein J7I98_08325 [Streptomyces sp. ISL-98]|uniref:hypothetical protein n=1 Tax=Streptomyces sp. ISL-98 TaxID=2819192 RepID=UPI001BE7EC99|nr:hypothetical protein [Streptomyces sp. ISL-98]MBT2505904.1 hypothetical protein [Streptomyces sp. ISL-98]
MRRMRRAGCVVVGVAVVVLSGCSGGDEEPDAEPSTPPTSSAPAVEPETVEPAEPEIPETPEEEIDKLAGEKGWVVDSLYASASEYV